MSVIKTFKEQFNERLQEVNDLSEAATKLMGPVVNQSIGSNQLVELRSQLDECANDIDKMLDEINKVLGNEPENNTDSASRLEMDEFVKQVISKRFAINQLLKGIDLKLAKGDLSGTSENPSVREFHVDKPSVIKVNTNVSASTDSDSPGQVGTTNLKSPTNSSESTPIEVQDQLSRRVREIELQSDKRDSQMTKIVEMEKNIKDATDQSMVKLQTVATRVDEHSRSRDKNTGGASSTNEPTIKNTQAECSRVLTENPQMLIAARQVLREFDGTVSEYPLFINTFDHFIDKNPHFTQDVKLGVLMSLLKGRAAQEIQATAFTADEYDVVRSNMERQYNRNKLQEQLLLEKLFDFQFAEDNVAEVQSSLNEYCNLAYRLERQGIDLDNRYFLFGFVDKLPPRMRAKVHKRFLKSDTTFKDLSEKAYELLAMFEAQDRMNRKAEERKRRQMVVVSPAPSECVEVCSVTDRRETSQESTTTESEQDYFIPPSQRYPCSYCGSQRHNACQCNLAINRKLETVNKKGLCRNCLSNQHKAARCKSRFNCYHCNGHHFSGHCIKKSCVKKINCFTEFYNLEDDVELQQQLFRD